MRMVACLIIGFALGLVGGFVQTWVVHIAGHDLPAGFVLVLATAVPIARAAAWWQGSRWGGLMFLLGWVAATLTLGITTPSGDLVLSGGAQELAYLTACTALLAAAASFPLIERPPVISDEPADA